MGRFRYLPITYDEYMNKYVNSLKTGELLVDLSSHDVYVTEEGFNIPIPTTKGLKEHVIKYLNTDLEGLKVKKRLTHEKTSLLTKIQRGIEQQQAENYKDLRDAEAAEFALHRPELYIGDINRSNLNQLGDLVVKLEGIKEVSYRDRIQALTNEFNRLNNDARSVYLTDDMTKKNYEIAQIWAEIDALYTEAHGKLDRLGSFAGEYSVKNTSTKERTVYDVMYSRRLWNWSGPWPINNQEQYINSCKRLRYYFKAWIEGEGYQDIAWNDILDYNVYGTGLFYKGFPHKINKVTGTKRAQKYNAWDLFEGLPNTVDEANGVVPGWNPEYINHSMANNQFPDYYGRGAYSTDYDFTSKLETSDWWREGCRLGGGSQRWQTAYTQSGNYMYTNNRLLDKISYVDDTGLQRIPRCTKDNADLGCFSTVYPSMPIITYQVRFVSTTGIRNYDGCVIRAGVKKTINQTIVTNRNLAYNDDRGWS